MRGTPLRDLNSAYLAPPWRDPPEPPDYWQEELRRVIDIDGELLVVYRDQDGDEFVMTAYAWDHRGEP